MADAHIMEALARVEHKLDALMRHLKIPMPAPMHFVGSMCPACGALIDYQVDINHGVVVRKCNCKTGKFPTKLDLGEMLKQYPPKKGEAPHGGADADDTEDGPERKAR